MAGSGITQQRGSGVPNANALLQRVLNLETALGIQGVLPTSYFTVMDGSGYSRTIIGTLPNGSYGILAQDPLGNQREISLPVVTGYYDGIVTTTSATYVSLSDFGTLDVTMGGSGDAIITVSAGINVTTTGQSGKVGVSINGGTPSEAWLIGSDNNNSYYQHVSSVRQMSLVTGVILNEGTNTFALQYASSTAADTANFEHISLVVQPI